MESVIVGILVLVVLWLVGRQSDRTLERERLEALEAALSRLDTRLTRLEKAATPIPVAPPAEAAAPATPEPAPARPFPPILPKPTPPAAVHVRPLPRTEASYVNRPPAPEPTAKTQQTPTEASEAPAPKRSISLEERLGHNWLNKLGIVSVVIGIALLLGYKVQTLGPLGKSMIGLTFALAILATGLLLERRDRYRIFARALIGGGWALTFFVSFAFYHVDAMRILHSQAADLVLMFAVAAAMVLHSLRYKSQVVTSLAFLLAFVTVGISQVTFFSLVAGVVLVVGLVFVAARERWYELALAGLTGAYINHFLWLHRVLPNGGQPSHPFPEFLPSAALILLYWLIFRLFYVLRVPEGPRQQTVSSLTTILNSAGMLSLLKFQSAHPEWAFWALLTLGAAELVLAFAARRRWHIGFVVLSTIASALLLAAIPFRFGGASWSLLWLLQAEMLFLAGVRMPELAFRRLGQLAAFAAFAQLLALSVMPVFELRQLQPDVAHHWPTAIALLATAAVFWLNAEFATRRVPSIAAHDLDRGALRIGSYLALLALAFGLWLCLPGVWTILAWLPAALVLGWVADRLDSRDLATQSDLLAFSSVIRAAGINLPQNRHWGWLTLRAATVAPSVAMLYAAALRKTRALWLDQDYAVEVYTWLACVLLAALLWFELPAAGIALGWAALALLLFEPGLILRRGYLRHQSYALLLASLARTLVVNLDIDQTGWLGPRLYTVLPFIAACLWVYQRLHASPTESRIDRAASLTAAWAATLTAGALAYLEVAPQWVALAWTTLALLTLIAGWALKRRIFVEQSLVLLLAAAAHALVVNLFTPASAQIPSNTYTVGIACALMLLALPTAFAIRRQYMEEAAADPTGWRTWTVFHPEQPFFFVPLVLTSLLLALQLRAGMITVGWSALGVLVFLLALAVGERSYRLSGLALLLLGAGKIVCVDIWQATPTDRYLTLIAMGAAMLLVSFLYSRYRETILKLL